MYCRSMNADKSRIVLCSVCIDNVLTEERDGWTWFNPG